MNKLRERFSRIEKKKLIGSAVALVLICGVVVSAFAIRAHLSRTKAEDDVTLNFTTRERRETTTHQGAFSIEEILPGETTETVPADDEKRTTKKAPATTASGSKKPEKTYEDPLSLKYRQGGGAVVMAARPEVENIDLSGTEESPDGYVSISKDTLALWQKVNDDLFFFDETHNFLTGIQTLDGVKYRFNGFGALASRNAVSVSSHNGGIDWTKAAAAGVDYAVIRAGYRGYGKNGGVAADTAFEVNMRNAIFAGVKTGVYFSGQAVNEEEAVEEAKLAVEYAKKYAITLPVYYQIDFVGENRIGRADALTKESRTRIAAAFCETVRQSGLKAGVFAEKDFYYNQLVFSELAPYEIWVNDLTEGTTDFSQGYRMWQYSSYGAVDGIPGAVDVSVCVYDYAKLNSMNALGSNIRFY